MGACLSVPKTKAQQRLFAAIRSGDSELFVQTLSKLSNKRTVDELLLLRDNNDNTLLIKACSLGSYHLVRLLIERYGADTNAANCKGITPLMASLETPGIVQYLCSKNVLLSPVDIHGKTAEQRAGLMGMDSNSSVYTVEQRLNFIKSQQVLLDIAKQRSEATELVEKQNLDAELLKQTGNLVQLLSYRIAKQTMQQFKSLKQKITAANESTIKDSTQPLTPRFDVNNGKQALNDEDTVDDTVVAEIRNKLINSVLHTPHDIQSLTECVNGALLSHPVLLLLNGDECQPLRLDFCNHIARGILNRLDEPKQQLTFEIRDEISGFLDEFRKVTADKERQHHVTQENDTYMRLHDKLEAVERMNNTTKIGKIQLKEYNANTTDTKMSALPVYAWAG